MAAGRARTMRAAGLIGRHRSRRHRTTIPDPHAATRPDLVLRDFQPDFAIIRDHAAPLSP
ncbi:hypothetical protein [Streptomyces sp. NPDC001020]